MIDLPKHITNRELYQMLKKYGGLIDEHSEKIDELKEDFESIDSRLLRHSIIIDKISDLIKRKTISGKLWSFAKFIKTKALTKVEISLLGFVGLVLSVYITYILVNIIIK